VSALQTAGLVELASRRSRKPRPTRQRLDLAALQHGSYLAADPSLSGFGLVLLEVAGSGVAVHLSQTFAVPPSEEHSGWEDILVRVEALQAKLVAYLDQWVARTDWGQIRVVHEAPPIGHGKLLNPEIPLLASREFRRATAAYPMLAMVRRQDHARLVCGNPNATKIEHHRALKGFYPALRGAEIVTNAATRDALSVGLYAAQRGF
jgi:hypothetical protein